MPIYEYQCVDCNVRDLRLGALDDHTARCVKCGSLMLRIDYDPFNVYFQSHPDCPWCGQTQPGTSKICQRHAAMLGEEER